jgi:hypothetical protein
MEAEDSDVPENVLIELVLRNIGLEYIPKRAIHMQKYYMGQPNQEVYKWVLILPYNNL